jgi:hypothetical protein
VRRTILVLLLALGTACGSQPQESADSSAPAPTTSAPASSTTVTTAPPMPTTTVYAPGTVEGQIEAAYLAAWDDFAIAMRRVEPQILEQRHDEVALDYRRENVSDLARDGLAAEVVVEHDYVVQQLTPTRAAVVDTYVNHMRAIDPVTGDFAEPDPNSLVGSAYTLELRGTLWVIIDIDAVE